jgi:PXPV repeat-containing protein
MNRLSLAKLLVATAGALAALGAASVAHARSDVVLSIGIQAPYAYVQPAPVYVQPRHVYVQPEPVYVQPQPIYSYGHDRHHGRHGVWGDADRDGVPNVYDRDSRYYDGHAARRAAWGDADRDGVPNRYDRAPQNPYRR